MSPTKIIDFNETSGYFLAVFVLTEPGNLGNFLTLT